MRKYRIKVREEWVATLQVTGDTKEEAFQSLMDGDSEEISNEFLKDIEDSRSIDDLEEVK